MQNALNDPRIYVRPVFDGYHEVRFDFNFPADYAEWFGSNPSNARQFELKGWL